MYTINNKFGIGEECYTVVRETVKCECPVCKGNRKFTYNDYEIPCKQCGESGSIKTNQNVLTVCKVKVKRINVSIWKENITVKYKIYCVDDIYRNVSNRAENSLFKTLEGAEEYCKQMNTGQIDVLF